MKQIIKKTISMFLTFVIILLIALNITGIVTRKNNYGVSKIFGYSVMEVLTDSMEPTLKVGTLVFVKNVDASTLVAQETDEDGNITVEGDIISFYRSSDAKVVTHRLLKKTLLDDGTYRLECFGDNKTSDQCTNNDCSTYPHDIINSSYLMGKVVGESYALGKIYSFMSQSYISLLLILVPGTYVVITALIDFLHEGRKLKLERDEEKARLANGGLSREEEIEKLKNELKEQMKKDLENKKEGK